MAFTLTNQHMTVLRQLRDGATREIFNPALPDLLAAMAGVKLVAWDVSERPIRAGGELGYGRVAILPDGISILDDLDELCPEVSRIA